MFKNFDFTIQKHKSMLVHLKGGNPYIYIYNELLKYLNAEYKWQ